MKIIVLFIFLNFLQLNGQSFQKKSFPLPEIKELEYVAIPSALERIFSNNSCQDNLIRQLKSYNRKLNNVRQYEVYLITQNCEFSQNACLCFETIAQGEFNFLLFYDRKSKQGKVLISSYNFLSDSEVYTMRFKKIKNEIRLTDSGITEGENGKAEEFSKNIIKVSVLQNGEIKVKSEKE